MLHDLQGLGSLTTIWGHLSDTWDRIFLCSLGRSWHAKCLLGDPAGHPAGYPERVRSGRGHAKDKPDPARVREKGPKPDPTQPVQQPNFSYLE